MEDIKKIITATEFKQNLGKYMDYVSENHEIVITKNGQPTVRVSPYVSDIMHYMMLREEAPKYNIGETTISYEEFLEISSQSEGRMEYINGRIIMQAAPNSFHQEAVGNLHVILKNFFKGKPCKVFLAPFDVTFYKKKKDEEELKTPDVIQPDLLVACDANEKINEKGRYSGIPSLVIEILSPSTRSVDMVEKLNTFMLGDCKEFWIIDPIKKTLMQYGFKDRSVEVFETYTIKDTLYSYAFVDLQLSVMEIFEE